MGFWGCFMETFDDSQLWYLFVIASYQYDEPKGDNPFSINTEIAKCPWNEEHYLLTVGLQVEFNPYSVEGYRLIGYENRALQKEDFTDDTVDAGEVGAGHSVSAIYEVVPTRNILSVTQEEL